MALGIALPKAMRILSSSAVMRRQAGEAMSPQRRGDAELKRDDLEARESIQFGAGLCASASLRCI